MTVQQFEPEKTSIQLHYVYAYADGIFGKELEKHLAILQRQGCITEWHSHEITPATDGKYISDEYLITAQIILLLISHDFLALDFCYGRVLQQAVERHENGEAIVIPIILRPANWQDSPFDHLSTLPDNGEPITQWENQDEAYINIIEGIQYRITSFRWPRGRQKLVPEPETSLVSEQENTHSIKLFYVYTGEDQNLCNQLEKHLVILQKQGFISAWSSWDILRESIADDEFVLSLGTAQIVLLLISPDLLASEALYSAEMGQVLSTIRLLFRK